MKRAVLVTLGLATFLTGSAQANEWKMAGKDSLHTNSVPTGPSAPFRRAWVVKADDPDGSLTTWPIVFEGLVYARSAGGIVAVDPPTGKKRWWTSTDGAKQITPAVDESRIYLPLPRRQVRAIDRFTGEEVWRIETGKTGLADPSPVLAEGRLYFGLPDEKAVFAIDIADGSQLWKTSTEYEPDSVPVVSDQIVVFTTQSIESSDVIVLALEAASGKEVWRTGQREGNSSPSILDGKVILGGGDFFAYALDLKTGKEIWKSPVEDKFSPRNMPAIAFGDVFLADRIGNIYRLDGQTGRRKWIFRDTKGTMDQAFPVIAGKTLFIGSGAGNLYALDTETGRLLWQDQINGIVLSGAADSERFYFGVKFGDEGLYAYEHDPKGKLEPAPGIPGIPGNIEGLIGGVILFALVFAGILLYTRRRRRGGANA